MNARFCLRALIGSCAVVSSSLAGAATTAVDAEQQLRKLEHEWTAAEINRDANGLKRILDDRFVATYGSGKRVGKEEFISDVVGTDADRILAEELSAETYLIAGDTAVVTETDTIRALHSARPYTQVLRISTTYIRHEGRWVALAEHFSPVPGAAAGAGHFDAERATAAYMATLSAQARSRSDKYFEGGYWLALWDFLVGLFVAVVLLGTGLSQRMRDFAERTTRREWLQTVMYGALYVVVTTVMALPWAAYRGYFREHQYRMSNQTAGAWLTEEFKGLLVGLILGVVAIAVLYAVARKVGRTWWQWGAVASIVFLAFQTLIGPT
jgi:hypothetical protein